MAANTTQVATVVHGIDVPSYLRPTGAVLREVRGGRLHIRVERRDTHEQGYAFSGDLRCAARRERNGERAFNFDGLLRTRAGVARVAQDRTVHVDVDVCDHDMVEVDRDGPTSTQECAVCGRVEDVDVSDEIAEECREQRDLWLYGSDR